jgi:multidrug efflux pump subunit AcrA (membrane-fusion protein)
VLWSRDGTPHVWKIDPKDSTVSPVPVSTGGFLDDTVRIVGGLSAGDRVVTAGANLLAEGQKIRLVEAAP